MRENVRQYLHFRDAYVQNENIFFSAVEINGLFCRKKNEKNAEFVLRFSGEDPLQSNLHSQIIEWENKLYFIPLNGRGISICDLADRKTETVPYKKDGVIQIISAFLVQTNILLLPINAGTPFLLFRMKDQTYERLFYLENEISKVIKREEIWIDTFSAAVENEMLYLAMPGTDILIICNLNTRDVSIKKLGNGLRLNAVVYSEKRIYMSAAGCPGIIAYDIDEGKVLWINENRDAGQHKEKIVAASGKGEIYVIFSNGVQIFNKEHKSFTDMKIPGQFCRRTNNYRLFAGRRDLGNALWLFSASGSGTLWIKDNKVHLLETFADFETENKIASYQAERIKREMEKVGYIAESLSEEENLWTLMGAMRYPGIRRSQGNTDGWSGNHVWERLKKS